MHLITATKRERIVTLDLLRGLFLMVIFADHLAYAPSLFFQFATGTSGMFASAAEGFFAISGILVGYIYGPKILVKTKEITLKIWRRAMLLYAVSVLLTLVFAAWAMLLPDGYPRQPNWSGSVIELFLQAASLQFHFGWADFLARYAVFMVIAPLAVWLIAKNYAWVVAIASFLVWLLWRDVPSVQIFSAWQFVFMIGIIIGFYLPQLESRARAIMPKLRKTLWRVIVGSAFASYSTVVLFFSIIPFFTGTDPHLPSIVTSLFDRESVGILRLALGVLWLSGLYVLFRRFEQPINRWTFGVLLLLGQNSLFVYSVEAFVIFGIDVFWPHTGDTSIIVNTLVGVTGMALVYFITRYKRLFSLKLYTKKNEVT